MAKNSFPEKDEFGVILEQLRKVQAATRVLIRRIQETRNTAWEWRDRRDALRGETPVIHEEMSTRRERRDELNAEVQRQKILRDEANEQARLLQEQLQELRTQHGQHRDYVPLEELQRQFRELEWKQQTTSLSVDEERALLDEMDRLSNAMETAPKRDSMPMNQSEEMEQLWQQIQETREKAQEHHEKMIALVEEAQQTHQSIMHLSQGIGPARSEIDEAHQMYVQCLQEADEMRDRVEVLRNEERDLKAQLDSIRKDRKAAREVREKAALERLAEQAKTKQQAGQKLSLEELRALMEVDGI
ncbi:MAG: coiled-coil protein [Promethearchaeota archaeon]